MKDRHWDTVQSIIFFGTGFITFYISWKVLCNNFISDAFLALFPALAIGFFCGLISIAIAERLVKLEYDQGWVFEKKAQTHKTFSEAGDNEYFMDEIFFSSRTKGMIGHTEVQVSIHLNEKDKALFQQLADRQSVAKIYGTKYIWEEEYKRPNLKGTGDIDGHKINVIIDRGYGSTITYSIKIWAISYI